MNENGTLQDIIEATLSLNLGITFYVEDKQKKVEIHDKHGKDFVAFTLGNGYQEVIAYLQEKLDQPTVKKLEEGKIFEYDSNTWAKYQAFRIPGVEEKYVLVNSYAKPKFFTGSRELYSYIERDTNIEDWSEIL